MNGPSRAVGHPDYSSTGAYGFIPAVWSGKLVEKFYDATVFAEIANTDYEGEIVGLGDTVIIRTVATMVVRDYVIGGGVQYDNPVSAKVELQINKAKYFGFAINDIEGHQSDLQLLDLWAADGGEQIKIQVDLDILSNIYADADADNAGATAGKYSQSINLGATGAPLQLSKTTIIDFLVDLGTVLDEQSVPESDRFVVLPAWACGMLKKSDLKDASITGDGTSVLRNGRLGMIDRFTLYNSNNLSVVTDGANRVTNIVAGHKSALTFAAQITEMETLKNPNDFGDLCRGMTVYGYKVTNPIGLAHGYVYK